MLNRDVKIAMAFVALSIILPMRMPAYPRTHTAASNDGTISYVNRYDSYENYHPRKKRENKFNSARSTDSDSASSRMKSAKKKGIQSLPQNEIIKYKVKRGDTITKISRKYRVPPGQIKTMNKITKNGLKTGSVIKIPMKKKFPADYTADPMPDRRHSTALKPSFRWPLHHVDNYKSDGDNGVKPIGIIISGRTGSAVISAAPGTVKKIGQMRGYGKYIVINHPGRFTTVYANLSQISVNEGESISAGNKIGNIPGNDNKLHFQIDYEGKPENPLKFLPKRT